MAFKAALLKASSPVAFAAACLAASPARADPVSLSALVASLIASAQAIGATALFTVGTYSLTVGAIVSPLVTTAIGIGISLLFAPRPKIPPPESGVIPVQQPLPYRIFVIGRTRVAGAIVCKEQSGPYLAYVAAIAGHFVDGFEALYLNDDLVTVVSVVAAGSFVVGVEYQIAVVGTTNFTLIGASANTVGVQFTATGVGSGTGNATPSNLLDGPVAPGADGRYGSSTINIDTRQGRTPETAYASIIALLGGEWTTNSRGDKTASLAMTCEQVAAANFNTVFPYAAPTPSVIVRGYQVYDPRDMSQDPTNPATFKWSQNCALCILYYLCFSEFGFQYSYAVAILPTLSFWIDAADRCDDAMALKAGGTEPRYTLGGSATAQMARNSALMAMLQCCDGFLSRRGQSYVLQVGAYEAPTVTLTDADIVGFTIQTDVATEDKVNEATANYCSPANGYITVDTDPAIDAVDQAARGGAPRKAQLDLAWVQSTGQASRLLVREMFRQGVSVRGTLIVKWSGLNAVFERWIAIDSNSIPRLAGVVIENRKAVIHPKTRTATIDFILSGPALDAYDPTTQESAPPSVPQRPSTVGTPVPANVHVVPELTTDSTGVSTITLAISCDEPFYNSLPWVLDYLAQYRLTDAGGGSPGPWTQQTFTTPTIAASRVSMQTGPVPIGTSLDVELGTIPSTLSTFSVPITVSTQISNAAPQAPAWISATGSSGHAALAVTAPNSANFYGVQFYRAVTGSPFSSATAIGSVVTGARNATINYTDTVAAGTYDYFAVAETSAAVASNPAGPETAVVT